jgi:hypothetical protein
MPIRVPLTSKRRKVKVPRNQMAAPQDYYKHLPPADLHRRELSDSDLVVPTRLRELSDSDDDVLYEDMGTVKYQHEANNIYYVNRISCPIQDKLKTETSRVQDETLKVILPYLEGNPNDFPLNIFGIPELQREEHVWFLKKALGSYPAHFSVIDASRPWMVYWSLQGLTALGHDISEFQERYVYSQPRFLIDQPSLLHVLTFPESSKPSSKPNIHKAAMAAVTVNSPISQPPTPPS